MKKPQPRKRSSVKLTTANLARRFGLVLIVAVIGGLQATSCSVKLVEKAPPTYTTPSLNPPPSSGQQAQPERFKACPQFFAKGIAPAIAPAPLQRELCYEAFAILHSGQTRTPVFVAEKLNRQAIADADEKRQDKFFADARLPRAERAELSDYKGSGYARGHMAPAGDMPTPAAMAQSFSLANMVPQNAKQNSGPWAKIEKDTRLYAARATGDVYVITGPVFDASSATVGANQVRVPSHLFKLVYDAETKRAWAYWQANADGVKAGPPISYQELVKRTGVTFLSGVGSGD